MVQRLPTAPQVVDPVESRSKRRCVTRDLERSISRLGEIVEVPVNVPRYTTCHTPVVATGVSRDCLYVLCPFNYPCMLVLTLDMLHSLIICGEGMDVLRPLFFCLDPLNNFVLSDVDSHSIRVFSPEGNLLHTIGREGHQPGMFYLPRGVARTPNGRLVCVSQNKNYGLQIFY